MEMEYVIQHRGSGRRTEYELLYDGRGREGQPVMMWLGGSVIQGQTRIKTRSVGEG